MNRHRLAQPAHVLIFLRLLAVAVAVGALLLLGVTTAGQLATELSVTTIIAAAAATVSTVRPHGQPDRTSLTAPPGPGGHPAAASRDERVPTTDGEDGA